GGIAVERTVLDTHAGCWGRETGTVLVRPADGMVTHHGTLVAESAMTGQRGGKLSFPGPWLQRDIVCMPRDKDTPLDTGRNPHPLHLGRVPVVVGKVVIEIVLVVSPERGLHASPERFLPDVPQQRRVFRHPQGWRAAKQDGQEHD